MKHEPVVDASPVIHNFARRMLNEMKFGVAEVSGAAAALKICNDNLPDVILLDWNRPETSSLDLLKESLKLTRGQSPGEYHE